MISDFTFRISKERGHGWSGLLTEGREEIRSRQLATAGHRMRHGVHPIQQFAPRLLPGIGDAARHHAKLLPGARTV